MTSRDTPLTLDEIKAYFKEALKNAVELGETPLISRGLPADTYDVIFEIASKYPEMDEDLVALARKTFSDFVAWYLDSE